MTYTNPDRATSAGACSQCGNYKCEHQEKLETPEKEVTGDTIYFEKGGALVKVELQLPDGISVGGERWKRKNEFHVTLVGFAMKLDKKYKNAVTERGEIVSGKQATEAVKNALERAAAGVMFQVKLGDEYRRAAREEDRSLIQMCNVEGMDQYLDNVARELGIDRAQIEDPPAHVTLYTGESGNGIGIATPQQLEERTSKLSEEDTNKLVSEITNMHTNAGL